MERSGPSFLLAVKGLGVLFTKIRLLGVVVIALVQLATVAYLGSAVSGGDAVTYLSIASDWRSWSTLLSPEAFEENFWPAGYPGVLAVFASLGDWQVISVRVLHVALAAGIALMAGVLVERVGTRVATLTTWIVAASPTMLWAVWAIGYELTLAFLLTSGLVLCIREWPRLSKTAPFLGGLLLGMAMLFQFRSVLAAAVLMAFLFRRSLDRARIAAFGIAIPVALWSLRSLLATGSPAPWSGNGPYNLWNGNNPEATGHNVYPLPQLPAGESSYTWAAARWVLENPMDFLQLTFRKFIYLFEPTHLSVVANAFPGDAVIYWIEITLALFIVVMLTTFIALRIIGRGDQIQFLDIPFWFAMAYLVPNIFFIVEPRFSIPVHGILMAISIGTFAYILPSSSIVQRFLTNPRSAIQAAGTSRTHTVDSEASEHS